MQTQEEKVENLPIAGQSTAQPLKAFVGGLAPLTTDTDLRTYFGQFGSLDEVCVMREKVSGRSRGFGFLTFFDIEVLNKVLDTPKHIVNGRTVEVKRAIPRGEVKSKGRKLFVGGISPTSTVESLRSHFEQFGPLSDAQIMKDRVRGLSRGFGFVTFEEDESVTKVLAEPEHRLDGKVVDVKKAEPKKQIPVLATASITGVAPVATNGSPATSPRGSMGYTSMVPGYAYAFMPYPLMNSDSYAWPTATGYSDATAGYFLPSPYTSPRGSFAIPLEADLPQDFAELSIGGYRRTSHDFGIPIGTHAGAQTSPTQTNVPAAGLSPASHIGAPIALSGPTLPPVGSNRNTN